MGRTLGETVQRMTTKPKEKTHLAVEPSSTPLNEQNLAYNEENEKLIPLMG